MPADVIVVGAGHNGLVCACYLARAGLDVLVLEQAAHPGGGARTEETVPGYRFDLHSVAHNIINMTDIPAELDLAGAGLSYVEMDPFSIAVRADGTRVRFWRSVDSTLESIAETDQAEADAYARFMELAGPIVEAVLPAVRGEGGIAASAVAAVRALSRDPVGLARDLIGPAGAMLRRRLRSDLTRGPVAAFAAHAGVGPQARGAALFSYWQAAYHRFGQWHARGGAGALAGALVVRLRSFGGQVRCQARVARIDATGGRVRGVVLDDGERLAARTVVTAVHPQVALLELLDPPLAGRAGRGLARARMSNAVQALVHVATDRLPAYPDGRPGDHNGLQSYVDRLDDMSAGFRAAEAGRLPDPLPLYAFTPSAIDDTLAPPGHHTVYVACPAAPARVEGGWDSRRREFAERCVELIEERAPGFAQSVVGLAAFTPADMERRELWPGGHPMHLDITAGQLGPLRPTWRLAGHHTPVPGLYITGAGTSPTGGIAGTPGRLAARAVLSGSH